MPLVGDRNPDYKHRDDRGWQSLRHKPDVAGRAAQVVHEGSPALLEATAHVIVAGGALMIGATRDGGAIMVRTFLGGEAYTDYASSAEEWDAVMKAVIDAADAQMVGSTQKEPKGARRRT